MMTLPSEMMRLLVLLAKFFVPIVSSHFFFQVQKRIEIRQWAQQIWKGAQGVSVYDMNSVTFFFEFQSKMEAEHILIGIRKRQGCKLNLQWWNPTVDSFPKSLKFNQCWIREPELFLHLWPSSLMKKIGRRCRGWFETKEEIELKNHLRWDM